MCENLHIMKHSHCCLQYISICATLKYVNYMIFTNVFMKKTFRKHVLYGLTSCSFEFNVVKLKGKHKTQSKDRN